AQNRHLARDRRSINVRHMSLRKLMLGLLRQRTDAVSENPDPNVVKIVIGEDRDISLIIRQRVTKIAAGLGVEQFPTAFGRVTDGIGVSSDEVVERRIE